MYKLKMIARRFATEENGAQIIEYSLIIAAVSLGLLIALRDVPGLDFGGFISRLGTCLSSSAACI
jgi:pilus assembly protein Flp/PilA